MTMALNKKCHNHLSNAAVLRFLTNIFLNEINHRSQLPVELDARMRIVKNIFCTFSYLIHGSILTQSVVETRVKPIFSHIRFQYSHDEELNSVLQYLNDQLNDSITSRKSVSYNNSSISFHEEDDSYHLV